MMIAVSNLWPIFLKCQDFNVLESFGVKIIDQNNNFSKGKLADYFFSWGINAQDIRHSVVETGFFKDSMHIDSCGLYDKSSFNFPNARRFIEDYQAPKSFRELNKSNEINVKYPQPNSPVEWDGIVLACQYSRDRSIVSIGSTNDYYVFLEEACRFYGKKLFLKKHPVMILNKEENNILDSLAIKYGCGVGHVGESILNKAESVLVYNSTYVIDALKRKVPVMQYTRGYFWQSGAVDYLGQRLSHKQGSPDYLYIDKFLDFLIWKYCFNMKSPIESIVNILKAFESSRDIFPLPEEYSYASSLLNV